MHPLRALRERGNVTVAEAAELLNDNIEFLTPVLLKSVKGKDLVSRIIARSSNVRHGKYLREDKLDDHTTLLYWTGEVDGKPLETMEIITDDENGKIVHRVAAYRPWPAVAVFRQEMYNEMKNYLGPEYWSYTPEDPSTLPK
jgi:hypothetical protein